MIKHLGPVYVPVPIYYPLADALEYATTDRPSFVRHIDHSLSILYDMETREIIGVRIDNPLRAFPDGTNVARFERDHADD